MMLFCFNFSGPGAQSKNQVVVLRIFANLFVTKLGEELMMKNFDWVDLCHLYIHKLQITLLQINVKMEAIYNSENRTCQIALATVLLKYVT